MKAHVFHITSNLVIVNLTQLFSEELKYLVDFFRASYVVSGFVNEFRLYSACFGQVRPLKAYRQDKRGLWFIVDENI